jgi:hypothetical protein
MPLVTEIKPTSISEMQSYMKSIDIEKTKQQVSSSGGVGWKVRKGQITKTNTIG